MLKNFKIFICLLILFGFGLLVNCSDRPTVISYSYNRPLQLEAFLRSLYLHVKNFGQVFVIYRADTLFENAYKKLINNYNEVTFLKQSNITPKKDFKILTLKALNQAQDYVIFSPDDLIVKDDIDLVHCMQMLKKTGAYGFYLRLGKNIVESYMMKRYTGLPALNQITENVYSWKFITGLEDWRYPNSIDFTLFPVKFIKDFFTLADYYSPNTLEGLWAMYPDLNKFGLCYDVSKVINIPLNVIQTDINNSHYLSKHISIYDLLSIFNSGKIIDIRPLYKINNKAPHMEYVFSYINLTNKGD